ncbi:MAG TPA: DUF3501 family protein [Candidatus Binataceae bacterium]|jgi:hypothetical protein|nr:DUF3501 family protein [Candidatus Binataceae bacterium]
MRAVQRGQIVPFEQYEKLRPLLRPLFIAEKNRRRLAVGEHLSLLFENVQTVWYQVQEMLRTERISSEEGIGQELDTYNELLPGPNELAATMLIEFTEQERRDENLRMLVGLENHICLLIGERRHQARFDLHQVSTQRVSSVQFLRFPLGGIDAQTFVANAAESRIVVEVAHPQMAVQARIGGALAAALAEDLAQS